MVLVVLAIVTVVALATAVLSRLGDVSAESSLASRRLETARSALEAFAGVSARLPCPADPAASAATETGLEVPTAVGAATCTFPEGTLPWKTLGMRRDDAMDPWGRRLSYRVYTGASGSLTQPGGVSMVQCDTVESSPGGVTTLAVDGSTGLCRPNADITLRATTPAQFLAGKGLGLTDMGAEYLDVAYAIVSHGATGLGGYTASGARLDLPAGDERDNTKDTGPFRIKAHSDLDTEATSNKHFDDLLVYRRLADLVQRIGLGARDWLDLGTTSVLFNQPTVSAALGRPVSPGGTGQSTIGFTGAQVTGLTGSSTPSEISFDTSGGTGGLGVAGGGSNLLQSSANESLRVDFDKAGRRFGATLSNFGAYGFFFFELVRFQFYLGDTPVGGPVLGVSCNYDGGLASFSVSIDQVFDRVEIVPLPAPNFFGGPPGITAFLVAEVKACDSTASACRTSLDVDLSRRCS